MSILVTEGVRFLMASGHEGKAEVVKETVVSRQGVNAIPESVSVNEEMNPSASSRRLISTLKVENGVLARSDGKRLKAQSSVKALDGKTSEEDRVREYRAYQALVARTANVFGDDLRASRWLSMPSSDFGGRAPLQIAQEDDYSLRRIDPVLIRIEHGIDF